MHFWSSLFLMSKMTFLFQMHPPLQTKKRALSKHVHRSIKPTATCLHIHVHTRLAGTRTQVHA